jgi:hypothetical protein
MLTTLGEKLRAGRIAWKTFKRCAIHAIAEKPGGANNARYQSTSKFG